MATHSSILAWEIPWTEKPGRLQSMGSQKSPTQLSDQTATTTKILNIRMSVLLFIIRYMSFEMSLLSMSSSRKKI